MSAFPTPDPYRYQSAPTQVHAIRVVPLYSYLGQAEVDNPPRTSPAVNQSSAVLRPVFYYAIGDLGVGRLFPSFVLTLNRERPLRLLVPVNHNLPQRLTSLQFST